MMDFNTAQRLVRLQERLRRNTYHEMRKDGCVHKSSEGAMQLSFHLPAVVGDEDTPKWSVWAYSYLLNPDGRQDRWYGRTPDEAISKAEDAIESWCFSSEMEEFESHFGPMDDGIDDGADIPI